MIEHIYIELDCDCALSDGVSKDVSSYIWFICLFVRSRVCLFVSILFVLSPGFFCVLIQALTSLPNTPYNLLYRLINCITPVSPNTNLTLACVLYCPYTFPIRFHGAPLLSPDFPSVTCTHSIWQLVAVPYSPVPLLPFSRSPDLWMSPNLHCPLQPLLSPSTSVLPPNLHYLPGQERASGLLQSNVLQQSGEGRGRGRPARTPCRFVYFTVREYRWHRCQEHTQFGEGVVFLEWLEPGGRGREFSA